MIDEVSRNLLVVAMDRIFNNIRRLQPDFDLETVTAPVEDEQTVLLTRSVASAVNACADHFKSSTDEEDASEEEGDEEDEDAGDDAST